MHFACWITKSTDAHSEYVILIHLHGNNEYADVISTLLALLVLKQVLHIVTTVLLVCSLHRIPHIYRFLTTVSRR
jgi:hypothetical protein